MATSQHPSVKKNMAGMVGLEPTKCRNQNPVPYQLGDIPIHKTDTTRFFPKSAIIYIKRKVGWIIGVEPTTSRATI